MYILWRQIVEDMSQSVNISFSFCFFQADGVLEASVRTGVDLLALKSAEYFICVLVIEEYVWVFTT
jgi:hypothetical protein